jgi:hypothetical protein
VIKPTLGSVVAVALEVEIASGLLRGYMFETAFVPMLTVALPKVLADFWVVIVRIVARISVFAVSCPCELFADLGSDIVG